MVRLINESLDEYTKKKIKNSINDYLDTYGYKDLTSSDKEVVDSFVERVCSHMTSKYNRPTSGPGSSTYKGFKNDVYKYVKRVLLNIRQKLMKSV